MELSRIKILFGGVILQLLFTIAAPLPYNKYGRQCTDIGCLSTQVCVMAYDSCSLNQREGNDCGRYPTCKKKSDAGLAAGPSDNAQDLYSNNPVPPKASAPSSGGSDDVLTSLGLNPNQPARPNQDPYRNPYPAIPANPPQPAAPYYPPAPAPAPPSGGNNYYGGGGGGGSSSGGNRRPGQYDGSGGNIVVPTQKPAAPSGGFFSGIFGGIQNAVSNAVKQQVGTYINQRLGIGPATGGAGGLFDANRFIDTKNFKLFSENKPSTATGGGDSGSRSSATGPYPVTVDQRTSAYTANAQPNRGTSGETLYRRQSTGSGTPQPYGWKLD